MRSMTRILPGLGLLLAVSFAGAQQPGGGEPGPGQQKGPGGKTGFDPSFVRPPPAPKKSALEEALEQALKNNPDLRVAASKLALAEAELSRTRLQITQKVAAAYAEVIAQRAVVAEMTRQLARMKQMHQAGTVPEAVLSKAESQLSESKVKLAAAERELDHLQGKGGRGVKPGVGDLMIDYDRDGYVDLLISSGTVFADKGIRNFVDAPDKVGKTDATEKLRQTLLKKTSLSGKKVTLAEYLAVVRKAAGGINVHANTKGEAWNETIDFDFEDVTIGGMFRFLEDSLAGHAIIVREYGLLIVAKDKVPAGASTLATFLRAEPTKTATPNGSGK